MGKDNAIRSIKIRTGNNIIERSVQLLCPMELHLFFFFFLYQKITLTNKYKLIYLRFKE